jgi:spermidine synthase
MRAEPRSRSILFAVAAAGMASLLAQVVLLRELLASSHGNELVLGVVLAGWLSLTGLASALGGRWKAPPEAARRALAVLLQLAPALLFASLWLVRFTEPLVLGQDQSLLSVMSFALLALVPASALGGLCFAWSVAAVHATTQVSKVYVAETLGMAGAGLVFHFVLARSVDSAWGLWGAGLVCVVAAWGMRLGGVGARRLALVGLALVAATGLAAGAVTASLQNARYPGVGVLASRPSRHGLLAVLDRNGQHIFVHDGVLLFTSEDTMDAEEMVHLPLLLHPGPQRILMIGGGLGGGLSEALKHDPVGIDYAEMDPEILSLARRFADARTRAALSDPRVRAMAEDARRVLRESPRRYDVILIDLPVPQNALQARLSTDSCFADARGALAPGGILVLATPGSDVHLDRAAKRRHASVLATLRSVFPSVGVSPGTRTFFWASERTVDARAMALIARMHARHLVLSHVGATWLADRVLPFHVADYLRALASVDGVVNRDFRPMVYLFGLAESLERVSPTAGRVFVSIARPWWAAGLVAVVGLAFIPVLARRGRGTTVLAVGAAGGSAMALQIVLLLAFQAVEGHLYHALGMLMAANMIGMALGAWWAPRLFHRARALAGTCMLAAGVAACVPLALGLARMYPGDSTAIVVLLAMMVGSATGMVFPVAAQVGTRTGLAARLYAWDLLGSAGAAAGTSLLAVPLLGLYPVAWLSAAACAAAGVATLRRHD